MDSFTSQGTIDQRQALADSLMKGALQGQRSLAPAAPLANLLMGLAGGLNARSARKATDGNQQLRTQAIQGLHWGDETTLAGSLAAHMRLAADGWGSVTRYPVFHSVGIHESPAGRYGEIALEFHPPTVHERVSCSLIYGNAQPWLTGSSSIEKRIDGSGLWDLIAELRRDRAPPRELMRFLASTAAHDESSINRMLANQIADKTVTRH